MAGNGLECKPGDRGDASGNAGIRKMSSAKSPAMASGLKSELSKGYESVNHDWHGNVKR